MKPRPDAFKDRVAEVLDQALAIREDKRADFVRDKCHTEPKVASEVISLLCYELSAKRFDNIPSLDPGQLFSDTPDTRGESCIRINGFKIKKLIGQGANSIVYEAHQLDPQRRVAIKVLRIASSATEAEQRMKLEGHIGARLEHPGITRIYQTGIIQHERFHQPYIVMEYADGQPLSSIIQCEEVSQVHRWHILQSIFQAVQFAHENGVIHRDIKPSNVMVNFNPHDYTATSVRVVDFGIAKLIDDATAPISVQTLDARALGTLRYMSPERISGASNGGTVASDIYSLGILSWELLAGERWTPTHEGDSNQHQLPVSRTVRYVLAKMTAARPEDRYQSARCAEEKLDAALNDSRLISRLKGIANRGFYPTDRLLARRRKTIALGVITAALTLSAAGWVTTKYIALYKESRQPKYDKIFTLEDSNSIKHRIAVHAELAGAFIENGEHSKARDVYRDLIEEIGPIDRLDVETRLPLLSNLAYAAKESGNLSEARSLYYSIRSDSNLESNSHEPHTWNRWFKTAHGLQSTGDPESARAMYEFALALSQFQEQQWWIRSSGLASYSGFLWTQGELIRAEELLFQSLQGIPIDPTLKERTDLATRQSSYALILDTVRRHREAQPYHALARESLIALRGPMDALVHRAALNQAANILYLGDVNRSLELVTDVKKFFQTSPQAWPYELMECDVRLAAALFLSGHPEQAIDQLADIDWNIHTESARYKRLKSQASLLLAAALIENNEYSLQLDQLYVECVTARELIGSEHPWCLLLAPYFVNAKGIWSEFITHE